MSNQKIANIANLNIVSIAAEKLISRQDGLPAIGVYYGPSGYGKTTTTIAVANATRAYYVQMRSAWSKKAFAEKICIELGVTVGKTISACLDAITEQLGASQRPLIIDEADYAAAKPGFVEFIRDIYEGSQSPVILVGEERLPDKLKRFERFHGRVLVWIQAQPVSFTDARLLAEMYAPKITIADDLITKLVELAHGSVRRVTVNLVNIEEYAATVGLDSVSLNDIDKSILYTGEAPRRGVRA
ncbi:AAA family ATPase [Neisseria sp. Ec49-e6-T10]|uniref:AAA family ATPase n=1 Tax=Neisseria sp. Ec49-e6-T10 TaxID=3140744 RepID=UPI003EBB8B13